MFLLCKKTSVKRDSLKFQNGWRVCISSIQQSQLSGAHRKWLLWSVEFQFLHSGVGVAHIYTLGRPLQDPLSVGEQTSLRALVLMISCSTVSLSFALADVGCNLERQKNAVRAGCKSAPLVVMCLCCYAQIGWHCFLLTVMKAHYYTHGGEPRSTNAVFRVYLPFKSHGYPGTGRYSDVIQLFSPSGSYFRHSYREERETSANTVAAFVRLLPVSRERRVNV